MKDSTIGSQAGLRLISLDVMTKSAGYNLKFPLIDFCISNLTEFPVWITKAIIKVHKVWKVRALGQFEDHVAPSKEYFVDLPVADHPYEVEVPMRQAVRPKWVDRFQLMLGSIEASREHPADYFTNLIYSLKIILVCDTNQVLDCGNLGILIVRACNKPYNYDFENRNTWENFFEYHQEDVLFMRSVISEIEQSGAKMNEELLAHVGYVVKVLRLLPKGGHAATSDVLSEQADRIGWPCPFHTEGTAFPPVTRHEPSFFISLKN